MRAAIAVLLCVPLTGCFVTLHGNQTTSGGVTTTTTSSQAGGTAKFSGGRASFSSGQPVAPNAQGGQVTLGRGGSAVLILGLVIADAVNYFSYRMSARTQPSRTESIADTCSCYQKPVIGEQ